MPQGFVAEGFLLRIFGVVGVQLVGLLVGICIYNIELVQAVRG